MLNNVMSSTLIYTKKTPEYMINTKRVRSADVERDIDVFVHNLLKYNMQMQQMSRRPNGFSYKVLIIGVKKAILTILVLYHMIQYKFIYPRMDIGLPTVIKT